MKGQLKKLVAIVSAFAMIMCSITIYNHVSVEASATASQNGKKYEVIDGQNEGFTGFTCNGLQVLNDVDGHIGFAWGIDVEVSSIKVQINGADVATYNDNAKGIFVPYSAFKELANGEYPIVVTATTTATETQEATEVKGNATLKISAAEETTTAEEITDPEKVDWNSRGWIGNGTTDTTLTDRFKAYVLPSNPKTLEVINFQNKNGVDALYMPNNESPAKTVTVNGTDITAKCVTDGAQTFVPGSALKAATYNEVVITTVNNVVLKAFIYNNKVEEPSETESPETPTTKDATADDYEWVKFGLGAAVPDNTYYYDKKSLTNISVVNIQVPGYAPEITGSYVNAPARVLSVKVNGVAVDKGIQGAGVCIDLSYYTKNINEVVIEYAGGTGKMLVKNASVKDEASATIDGEAVTVTNGKITLGDAQYGYYCNGKMYKAGSEVEVTEDMAFTSVKELNITMAQGAGIRYIGDSGLRFQATITSDNMDAVASDAITEGTLITTSDIYNEGKNGELDLTYAKTKLNIVNSGWFNNQTGVYCGSVCKIAESNYKREFVARAYVTINYADGTSDTFYSNNMAPSRSIQKVAQLLIGDNYGGISEEYHSVIDNFAK